MYFDLCTHRQTSIREMIGRHHILHKTLYKHVKEQVHGAPHVIVDHVYAPHRRGQRPRSRGTWRFRRSYSCSEGSQDWRGWSSSHKRLGRLDSLENDGISGREMADFAGF